MENRFEKIRIDLRPFGYGIRDVGVIWPEEHECKCEDDPDTVTPPAMEEEADDNAGSDTGAEDGGQGEGSGAVTPPAIEEEEGDETGSDTGAEDGGGDV